MTIIHLLLLSEIFLNLLTWQILVFGDLLHESHTSVDLFRRDENGRTQRMDKTRVKLAFPSHVFDYDRYGRTWWDKTVLVYLCYNRRRGR